MPTILKLTLNNGEDEPIFINTAKIIEFFEIRDSSCIYTAINLSGEIRTDVKETPDEILALLKEPANAN